jgi:hypothetical protein
LSKRDRTKQAESEWREEVNWFYPDKETKIKEVQKLGKLWENAQPMTREELHAVRQITWLSRCNWNLEPSIRSLIEAIGRGNKAEMRIGHNFSITEDRWKKVWAYYLALKKWLPALGQYTGIPVLLDFCDPNKTIQSHIIDLLGIKTKLKELYVELFSYSLEIHLMSGGPDDLKRLIARKSAVESLTNEIKTHKYDNMILAAVQPNPETLSDGKLRWFEICHHKFFRRCDIILSSIGENEWRGTFKDKGSEREELQELFLRYSSVLDSWISNQDNYDEFTKSNLELLGKHTSTNCYTIEHNSLKDAMFLISKSP